MSFLGHRYERHCAHMAAVREVQRRNQLQRVERVLAQHEAWKTAGVQLDGDLEAIAALHEMRREIAAALQAEELDQV